MDEPGITDFGNDGLPDLDIYYDSARTSFWVKNDRGTYIRVRTEDVKRILAKQGYRTNCLKNESISQVDALIVTLQKSKDVEYTDSLAGFWAGVYMINGRRVLVRDSPQLVEPCPGEWTTLQGIIRKMLGEDQEGYLFGWLKVAIESLRTRKNRQGQALTIAGPKDCGKSLIQNLFTEILGGRSHKPHRYMSGVTPFNSELFGAEHLMIEDEEASTDIRARRNFGTKIKEIAANREHSCHPKHRIALMLSPFWRLSITVNDEPENLMILPPIDSSLEDKIIILKASKHPMPMHTVTNAQRDRFMGTLRSELPAFVAFLLNWKIPDSLVSQRYGITHFHHPDILDALGAFSPENHLLEIIDAQLFNSPAPGSWQGSASQLQRLLTAHTSTVKREAGKILTFQAACGTYLGRLEKIHKHRIERSRTSQTTIWTIHPPSNGDSAD